MSGRFLPRALRRKAKVRMVNDKASAGPLPAPFQTEKSGTTSNTGAAAPTHTPFNPKRNRAQNTAALPSLTRTLRRRWALLCITLTGLVVLVLCGMGFFLAQQQLETSGELIFQTHAAALTDRFQGTGRSDDLWLARYEAENGLCVFLWDGGRPLRFSGGWMDADTRGALCWDALSVAGQAGFSPQEKPAAIMRTEFMVQSEQIQYQGQAVSWPSGDGWASCLILRPMTAQQNAARQLLLRYAALGAAGLFALGLIAWGLSGRAVRPIEESLARQTSFVAAASHELRSPLAVISANAQQLPALPENDPYAGVIQAEAARMGRLVGDLLLLAGSDARSYSLSRHSVSAETLLADLYARYAPLAAQKGIALCAELPQTPLPAIWGDAERLQQLLGILAQNALDYTPPDGTVTLGAGSMRGRVHLWVRDTGPGIPDAEKERVFERFYRADKSRGEKTHFGLGLSVARELAALHGGTLRAEDAPDGGACFVLTLPRTGL